MGALLRTAKVTADRLGTATLTQLIGRLGQIPFNWPPPNGYPDVLGYWATTNGLLTRWNLAGALAVGRLPGLTLDLDRLAGGAQTPTELVDQLSERLLRRALATADRTALIAYAAGERDSSTPLPVAERRQTAISLTGLLLSSAYFQQR